MNWIPYVTLAIGLAAGTIGGYYLHALKIFLVEMRIALEDRAYPKQRTYADKRRLEDLAALADQMISDIELEELRTRQDYDRRLREIDSLSKQIAGIQSRVIDARQSAPGEFPEEPNFSKIYPQE